MQTTKKIKNKKKINKKSTKFNSRHSQIFIQIIFDTVAIVVSFLAQYFIRFETGLFDYAIKPDFAQLSLGTLFLLGYWLTVFFFFGLYKNWYEKSPFEEIFTILKVTFLGTFIIIFLVLNDIQSSPRMLFLLYFAFISFSMLIGRITARELQKRLRAKGIIKIPVIIYGNAEKAYEFYRMTKLAKNWGYYAYGIILNKESEYDKLDNYKNGNDILLGTSSNIDNILREYKPEVVVINSESTDHKELLELVAKCDEKNIRVKIKPDLYDIFTGQTKTQNLYGIPLIEIRTQLMKPWQEVAKRIFDVVFSSLVIILGFPIWATVAIITKLESEGPVFYTQPRVGKDGRVFKIFKYRSMVKDADKHKQKWTSVGDPRVTKWGRFIRKTHLDEIPQFWNVIIGDMSVVGPRPEQPKFVEQFSKSIPHYKRRLKVRPGITGWWQVKYTAHELNEEEIKNRIKDDFYYIENMSLQLDFEIVIRTVYAVLTGHGQT